MDVNLTNHNQTKSIYLYMGIWGKGPDPKLLTLLGVLKREGRPIYKREHNWEQQSTTRKEQVDNRQQPKENRASN